MLFDMKRHEITFSILAYYKTFFTLLTMCYNAEKSPFWQDNALFASKAKINVFWNFFEWRVPEGDYE